MRSDRGPGRSCPRLLATSSADRGCPAGWLGGCRVLPLLSRMGVRGEHSTPGTHTQRTARCSAPRPPGRGKRRLRAVARVGGQSIEHGLGSLLEVSAQRADVQLLPCRRRCCRSLSGSGRSRSGRPGSLSRRHRAAKKRQLSEPRTRSGSKCLTSGTGHPYGQVRVVRCGHARASFQAAQSPYEAITNRPGWCVRN